MSLDEKLRKAEEFLMEYQNKLEGTRKIISNYVQYISKLKPMEDEKNEQLRKEFIEQLQETTSSTKNIADLISQTLSQIDKALIKFDELSAELVGKEKVLNDVKATLKKYVEIIRKETKYQILCIIQEHDSILINDLARLTTMEQDELSNTLRELEKLKYISIQGDMIYPNKEIPKLMDL